MHIPALIERKRDGHELTEDEIHFFVQGAVSGDFPPHQAAALLMAIYFQGMTFEETALLTGAMAASGARFQKRAGDPLRLDKHSTGGVGDKTSLVIAPLLAAAGFWVPMISGRGLGLNSGTLDKLEAIPGFRIGLSMDEADAQLRRIGCFIIGQTKDIAPADRAVYHLRDVTGTVPSKPLITSSILCKKLAEGLDRLILDVKFGTGSSMKTEDDARDLGELMSEIARLNGMELIPFLTPTDEPLGEKIGHTLEVVEAIETLRGEGPKDFRNLCLDLSAGVSELPYEELSKLLSSGAAWEKWVEMVEAQGGSSASLERLGEIDPAPLQIPFAAQKSGVITSIDAGDMARAVILLGGSRIQPEDSVDLAVGCSGIKKIGDTVSAGEPIFVIHARSDAGLASAMPFFERAIGIE